MPARRKSRRGPPRRQFCRPAAFMCFRGEHCVETFDPRACAFHARACLFRVFLIQASVGRRLKTSDRSAGPKWVTAAGLYHPRSAGGMHNGLQTLPGSATPRLALSEPCVGRGRDRHRDFALASLRALRRGSAWTNGSWSMLGVFGVRSPTTAGLRAVEADPSTFEAGSCTAPRTHRRRGA